MRPIAPPLQYWFGLRTFAPIIASGFSGWVGLSQMRLTVDDLDFWLLLCGGLLAGFVSWAAIAYDSWQSDQKLSRQETISIKMGARVEELLSIAMNDSCELIDLEKLSSNALKAKVLQLIERMETFVDRISTSRSDQHRFMRYSDAEFPESLRTSLWYDMIQTSSDQSAERQRTYEKELYPIAKAVWEELLRRVGRRSNGTVLGLDIPLLAGAWPIGEAIVELRQHASRLPDSE